MYAVSIIINHVYMTLLGFPGATVVNKLPANAGDTDMQVGSLCQERSPGGGNGNTLQYSSLENSMDRGT